MILSSQVKLDDAIGRDLPVELHGTVRFAVGCRERRLVGLVLVRVEVRLLVGRVPLGVVPFGDREVDSRISSGHEGQDVSFSC